MQCARHLPSRRLHNRTAVGARTRVPGQRRWRRTQGGCDAVHEPCFDDLRAARSSACPPSLRIRSCVSARPHQGFARCARRRCGLDPSVALPSGQRFSERRRLSEMPSGNCTDHLTVRARSAMLPSPSPAAFAGPSATAVMPANTKPGRRTHVTSDDRSDTACGVRGNTRRNR